MSTLVPDSDNDRVTEREPASIDLCCTLCDLEDDELLSTIEQMDQEDRKTRTDEPTGGTRVPDDNLDTKTSTTHLPDNNRQRLPILGCNSQDGTGNSFFYRYALQIHNSSLLVMNVASNSGSSSESKVSGRFVGRTA